MNKKQQHYIAFWAILFILFQAIAFISPGWIKYDKYTASFWIGYIFINASFLLQLQCAIYALKEENLTKLFYKIPLIRVSYTGLILSFLLGGACMLISPLPYWIAALTAVIVYAATALAVVKASAAADLVEAVDSRISHYTHFIRNLTAEAENLMKSAQIPEAKVLCKKVYEALRYSDPMSSEELGEIENKMKAQFVVFCNAVSAGSQYDTEAEKMLQMIAERNSKCKLYK